MRQFRKQRTKKIRSPIRVKERIAKKGGRCAACKGRYEPGAEVTVVNIRRRTYHRLTCVPANAGQLPTTGGTSIVSSTQVAQAISINWTAGEAALVALVALENVLTVRIKKGLVEITPELDKAWERFNKFKGSMMHVPTGGQVGNTEQEKKQAMRLAFLDIVKMVF